MEYSCRLSNIYYPTIHDRVSIVSNISAMPLTACNWIDDRAVPKRDSSTASAPKLAGTVARRSGSARRPANTQQNREMPYYYCVISWIPRF